MEPKKCLQIGAFGWVKARPIALSAAVLLSCARRAPRRRISNTLEAGLELTAEGLWNEVSGRLRGALNETTYRTWFGDVASVELDRGRVRAPVPTDFAREWIEGISSA